MILFYQKQVEDKLVRVARPAGGRLKPWSVVWARRNLIRIREAGTPLEVMEPPKAFGEAGATVEGAATEIGIKRIS